MPWTEGSSKAGQGTNAMQPRAGGRSADNGTRSVHKGYELLPDLSVAEDQPQARKTSRKMLFLRSFVSLLLLTFASARALSAKPKSLHVRVTTDGLQDIVTWDEHSIFVRGERVLFYSGEFHPFRLPVTDLWLDVFQKIKALGYSGVSFYTDWALLEGTPGTFRANGIFALDEFFAAAKEAGIYLLARPGPYINAEVSGGGFPGWLQRIKGTLRTNATDYLQATEVYSRGINEMIAKGQITNGGPVILYQPENEYSYPSNNITFPNYEYMAYVEQQARDAGIVVPFISNDAGPQGLFAPGNGTVGNVNIYGHDSYPLGFDCANPYTWPDGSLPGTEGPGSNFHLIHEKESPTTPYSIVEFQGGSFDPWGGPGFEKCASLLNEEFERVFYKNDFSFGVTVINFYMTYGGTNWGNLGQPGGYTSYDYGAAISEDLEVTREKYSEAKLLANFLKKSPAYLTATAGLAANGSYVSNDAIDATPLYGNGSSTAFYVIRQASYNSLATTEYTWSPNTTAGVITVPQLSTYGSSLKIIGRDAKMSVTDYDVGGTNLLYCSSDIFTWESTGSKTVLVLYGAADETHEFALPSSLGTSQVSGTKVTTAKKGSYTVVQWQVTPSQQSISFGDFTVYLLWRNDVYNWWSLELPAPAPVGNFTSPSKSSVIVKGGYLMRSASISGNNVYLTGDINSTTSVQVVSGAPANANLYFNGKAVTGSALGTPVSVISDGQPQAPTASAVSVISDGQPQAPTASAVSVISDGQPQAPAASSGPNGVLSASIAYVSPSISLPDLSSLEWKYIDSLPEIQPSYDDSKWPVCSKKTTNNPTELTTPTSLYASDYGFNTGSVEYRGQFAATSSSSPTLKLETQGGYAFGHSIWLNSTFIGSWVGIDADQNYNASYTLPVSAGESYIITILIDNMGLAENFSPGADTMKAPRGILTYSLSGYAQDAITWKIQGNLGGENYADLTRGPLNEGALYAERQGYHLPAPPSANWPVGSPLQGFGSAGVRMYTTSFSLNLPTPEYQIPLSFVFSNASTAHADYRSMLFVNGYQFGKYVNNIGPQTSYPVPEGILNYNGENWVAVTLWALDEGGASVQGLDLVAGHPVMSGRGPVRNSPMPAWKQRVGAY